MVLTEIYKEAILLHSVFTNKPIYVIAGKINGIEQAHDGTRIYCDCGELCTVHETLDEVMECVAHTLHYDLGKIGDESFRSKLTGKLDVNLDSDEDET